jgi:hypothetical protein
MLAPPLLAVTYRYSSPSPESVLVIEGLAGVVDATGVIGSVAVEAELVPTELVAVTVQV